MWEVPSEGSEWIWGELVTDRGKEAMKEGDMDCLLVCEAKKTFNT